MAKPRTKVTISIFILSLVCLLAAFPSRAAFISGRVVDDQNRAVPNLRVTANEIVLSDCCPEPVEVTTDGQGAFSVAVTAGVHALFTAGYSRWNPAAKRVDTRSGSVSDLVLQMKPGLPDFLPNDPPRSALIALSILDESGMTHVAGAAGAVPPSSFVILVTVETGDFKVVQAAGDGSFSTDHFAPSGTSILIKADPAGIVAIRALREGRRKPQAEGEGNLAPLSGTLVHVPEPSSSDGSIPVFGAGRLYSANTPVWIFRGSLNKSTFKVGDELRLRGTIESRSVAFRDVATVHINFFLSLEMIADDLGSRGPGNAVFWSPFTTPTGFPIERYSSGSYGPLAVVSVDPRIDNERLATTIDSTIRLTGVRPGWYRPLLALFAQSPPVEPPNDHVLSVDKVGRQRRDLLYLPVVRVSDPPAASLHWLLLLDTSSNGARGLVAIEDRGLTGMSSRIAAQTDTLTVPRVDPLSGEPVRYELEPFLPQISLGDRGIVPSAPFIPFRFPSGRLTMRLHQPDGSTISAGPAPFVQSRSKTIVSRDGFSKDKGGGHPTDVYQITTGDPRFEVSFTMDGLHVVELEGEVEDAWGNRWAGRGTYEIQVARVLSLDTATLPGTPFEAGDSLDLAVFVPGEGSCDVEAGVTLAPGSKPELRRWTIRGRTNRFGFFQPGESVTFTETGEYRVDVTSNCREANGTLAVGSRTWGGVVAPTQTTIAAHGRRGIDDQTTTGPQWFFRRQTTASPIANSHVFFPFHSGDVTWQQKSDAALPAVTIQDRAGSTETLLRGRSSIDAATFNSRASLGEIALFSSRPDLVDPIMDPSKVDLWGYSYRSVQRPLVRVREIISEDGVASPYWRFNEHYGGQAGVGRNGDLPNDLKFQFGGAVLRGNAVGTALYSIYASLFVLVSENDPGGGTRTFPPFQGNGGGPTGGPLMTLKGKPIDIFFHPTAVRPGTILQPGETASFAGYSAPTLPSKIEIVVTSPSGLTRTIKGQANKIGYFYDQAQDFVLYEAGVWKAKVKITFDGQTSAGQVTAPFPTGDVLGSREGEFYFYVVAPDAPPLNVGRALTPSGPAESRSYVRPADGPITFTITPPASLTNVEMFTTTTMPGFILEETHSVLAPQSSVLSYTYDAQKLAKDFPNLDLYDADGFAGADTITMSFLVSGSDANGIRRHFARQIVLQGEELQMPAQTETIIPPRRRGVPH